MVARIKKLKSYVTLRNSLVHLMNSICNFREVRIECSVYDTWGTCKVGLVMSLFFCRVRDLSEFPSDLLDGNAGSGVDVLSQRVLFACTVQNSRPLIECRIST